MSKKVNNLLISPPMFINLSAVERETFHGMNCTHCHGNGWFWIENDRGERVKEPCKVCKGTKKIKAVVTINWCADE